MESSQLASGDRRVHMKRWVLAVLGTAATAFGAVLALGFFAVVMSPTVMQRFIAAHNKAEMDIVSIDCAVSNFVVENGGRAPQRLEELVTPDEHGRTILKNRTSVPVDPWGTEYGYEPPTANRDYRIFTLGRDRQPGGSGDDADIDNFTIIAVERR